MENDVKDEDTRADDGLARLGVILPYNLLKATKAMAVQKDTTISAIVRSHLESDLRNENLKNIAKENGNEN